MSPCYSKGPLPTRKGINMEVWNSFMKLHLDCFSYTPSPKQLLYAFPTLHSTSEPPVFRDLSLGKAPLLWIAGKGENWEMATPLTTKEWSRAGQDGLGVCACVCENMCMCACWKREGTGRKNTQLKSLRIICWIPYISRPGNILSPIMTGEHYFSAMHWTSMISAQS